MIDRVKNDLKTAMKAREQFRVDTLRMLLSELKNGAINKRADLDEHETLTILTREVKKRREAAESFRNGARLELAEKEEAEAELLTAYLPEQLDEDAVRAIVRAAIAELNPQSPKEMGNVMGQVMPKLKGKFDGKATSAIVRDEFNKALAG
jgi:hypothetical protein